jgi:cytochrome c
MSGIEVNKLIAAFLVVGIVFFLTGLIGDNVIRVTIPAHTAINIAGSAAPAAPSTPGAEPPIEALLAQADAKRGEADTQKVGCVACHTFNQGGKAGIGPNLYGVVGGPHGHMVGFDYSAALKAKPGPWTYDALYQWLKKPSAYAPGTKMTFAGVEDPKQRADVIAYLRSLSATPEPLPAPQ